MQLFYSAIINKESQEYTFPRDESKHIIRVLRKQTDDTVYITNGKGYLFTGTIINENPNKCTIRIVSYTYQEKKDYQLHIAIAPTKLNDRLEWFLEKATEIGITEITPLLCDHSERKVIKEERLYKILQSAMKQSLQLHLPVLHPLTPFDSFINKEQDPLLIKCIAHCEDSPKVSLKTIIKPKQPILILIGPEGDFSGNEIKNAIFKGYKEVTLGTSRLRTETAGIIACHSVAFMNQ